MIFLDLVEISYMVISKPCGGCSIWKNKKFIIETDLELTFLLKTIEESILQSISMQTDDKVIEDFNRRFVSIGDELNSSDIEFIDTLKNNFKTHKLV